MTKHFLFFLLIIAYFFKSYFSYYFSQFELIAQKIVPFENFSLVPKTDIQKSSKTFCLSKCLINEYCEFVVYKNGQCSLHTEYALTRLVNSNLNVVYRKKLIINHCESSPCMNQGECFNRINGYECFCELGYFGPNCEKKLSDFNCSLGYFRKNYDAPCEPCRNNFSSYTEYPFNCYHVHTELNFDLAKLYCSSLNSTLWYPKSLSERIVYSMNKTWVNSFISSVGEPFVWPDGSKIHRFLYDGPDNYNGNLTFLNEQALELRENLKLNDFVKKFNRLTICQQV